jgi:hypothetical protein
MVAMEETSFSPHHVMVGLFLFHQKTPVSGRIRPETGIFQQQRRILPPPYFSSIAFL